MFMVVFRPAGRNMMIHGFSLFGSGKQVEKAMPILIKACFYDLKTLII